MSTHQHNIEEVSSIVHVLNSGIDFYKEAKEKVGDAQTAPHFERMIQMREQVKTLLQPYALAEEGDLKNLEEGSNFAVEARHVYTQILGKLSSDKQHAWVDQLEEVEDKTLESFDKALEEGQPVECEAALRKGRQVMQSCHDEMLALQKATAH